MSKKTKEGSSPRYHIEGGIHARNVIMGDQVNYYRNEQIANVASPAQFIEELQALRAEIEKLKSQPNLDPSTTRKVVDAEMNIQDAIAESKKDKPILERVQNTLNDAKATMDRLGGSVASAVSLGTALGNLALLAAKLFGG